MTTQPSEEDVAAIRDLLNRSTLVGIEYHELAANLAPGDPGDDPEPPIDMQLELQHRCSAEDFGFRLIGEVETSFGGARATVAATYRYEGDVPSRRTLFGFGNEIAVMTIFPYYREAVSSITAKVFGQPILLPVLDRGDVGFDLDDAPAGPAYAPQGASE